MSCAICKKWAGRAVEHTTPCPLASSMTCSRCFQRGHMTEQCSEGMMEHPSCLEDLIPANLRNRWGIHTVTPLIIPANHPAEQKIAPINTVQVPDDYTEMKEFIREHRIDVEKKTKESIANCRKAIIDWAKLRGYRVIMQHTISECSA